MMKKSMKGLNSRTEATVCAVSGISLIACTIYAASNLNARRIGTAASVAEDALVDNNAHDTLLHVADVANAECFSHH